MNLQLSCFLFTIMIINLSLSLVASGDATLIDTICTKTPYPRDCHVCFAGNSGSSQMNFRELAGAAMDCTYTVSQVVQQGFVDLASRATDPTVKGVYDQYGSGFGDFVNKLYPLPWLGGGALMIAQPRTCLVVLRVIMIAVRMSFDRNFVSVNNLYTDSGNIIIQSEANSDHY